MHQSAPKQPERREGRRSPLSQLAFRLMITFGVALMPLALLSFVQMQQYQQEADARAEAAVLGATMQSALPLIDQFTRAEGAASALAAAVVPVIDDPQACAALMEQFLQMPENAIYSFAGYVPRNLRMECSPNGPLDLSNRADLAAVMDSGKPSIRVSQSGAVSRTSVVVISHPVSTASGGFSGMLSISIPHHALELGGAALQVTDTAQASEIGLLTVNDNGDVLTASAGFETADMHLPDSPDLRALLDARPRSFTALSRKGEARIFAIVPLHSSGIHLIGSWPLTRTDARLFDVKMPILAFPALMWLASLLVAQLAAEHQVLRHIRKLRNAITQFADGSRRVIGPDLHDAPNELRALGNAFDGMMSSVTRDEAELEDTIHQKEVLLREVHHRVKNNLQLIASIINMQIRKARSPESRGLLKSLQDRVMSLATIHRELYQTTGGSDISADELLGNIVNQILRMAARPGEPFEVDTAFADLRLTPDQAVPLSLLVTEALTNALKYAGAPPGKRPHLSVRLEMQDGNRARVTIRNSAHAGRHQVDPALDGPAEGSGLGEALVRAFAAQLGTTTEVKVDETSYQLSFSFLPTALRDAEERLQS
ncbi:histidine kinase dimerization/phosphoacceptor domain -containing protein [Gemmobacter serpentinus]|uniref:histidine kinase dimerization/phosphoacceptor domain -containing protein n=1 Tax=Gemmobacter serpentinus TaxID=2652247 RepID=UPI00124CAED4|nr:histidine kinase dimerization/phosphoacceptor domain -containing protein [Gemmobacter serpentinus]